MILENDCESRLRVLGKTDEDRSPAVSVEEWVDLFFLPRDFFCFRRVIFIFHSIFSCI